MLPNLVFPLFPVVDYQTFRRTYYDQRRDADLRAGHALDRPRPRSPAALSLRLPQRAQRSGRRRRTLGDLVQFMLGTFLLYLRVSGQFHLIVGLLHLFGFRLPETHKLYYLAHSFTELWRRINIYWTDFMMKTVFYPTYFRVKKLGPTTALVLSTAAVFVTTWILHSYQWFWLRGGFPMTAAGHAVLGHPRRALVVVGALKELEGRAEAEDAGHRLELALGLQARRRRSRRSASCGRSGARSRWASGCGCSGAAANVDAKGVVLLVADVATHRRCSAAGTGTRRAPARPAWLRVRVCSRRHATVAMLACSRSAQPAVQARAPRRRRRRGCTSMQRPG